VVRALGLLAGLHHRWRQDRLALIEGQAEASLGAGIFGAAIRVVRLIVQALVIGGGAYLIIMAEIGPGVLFANMILASKALAPIERLLGSWNALQNARQSYERLQRAFEDYTAPENSTALPRPTGRLTVERASFFLPGSTKPILNNIAFIVEAGETVGIVGPSGAGKSTLARLILGVWPPSAGAVRLDGADVHTWDRMDFGRYIGYLPQDVELFAGRVRDNIARFRTDATDEAVVKAAIAASVHDTILRLPQGYDTDLREGGTILSGGQRQRVGLARALFGNPALVVLDEPNSNLDGEGELALTEALKDLKGRGATVILISHRSSSFATADKLLVLKNGQVEAFGPKSQILASLMKAAGPRPVAVETRP